MRAGNLRRRVTFQSRTETDDLQGGTTFTWTNGVTAWARVVSTGGHEFETAKQTRATLTDEVRIRYRTGITPDMRVVVGTRVLSITQAPIDVENRHRELILLCEEIVGESP